MWGTFTFQFISFVPCYCLFELCASLVSQVREYSHGTVQKQRKPKPHGPLASRDQTQIKVTFICQSVIVIFKYLFFKLFSPHTHFVSTELLSGSLSSPHQEVDNFVLTLVQKDGIQGSKCPVSYRLWLLLGCTDSKTGPLLFLYLFYITISALTGIRRWNYFAVEQLLVYDIIKYRWCENVQRFHKSNNIMYVFFHILAVFSFFLMECFFKKKKSVFLVWFPHLLQDCCISERGCLVPEVSWSWMQEFQIFK